MNKIILSLFLIFCLIISSYLLSLLPRSHTLECVRLPLLNNQVKCQLTHKKTFTTDTILIPINSLQAAGIYETLSERSSSSSYSSSGIPVFKILLYTSQGTLPFTYFYDNDYSSKKEQVLKIQYFLETKTEESLYIEQNNWLLFYFLFFLLIYFKFIVIREFIKTWW